MNITAPIRSRAAEEGNFEFPLWNIPLALLVIYVCLFSGLGALGLVGPDEPRYAAIARAMAETHDWITPRLWGTPWFEKPVLYYWCAGVAMRIFGVSEFAARLPSALAALLALAAVKWTALRAYGLATAWYSLLMLPASVAMIGFSRSAGPDMLFAGLLTAAMAVAYGMLQREQPTRLQQIAFGFFLGTAVLAKGPAAVILAGGATLLWAAIARQWKAPFRFLQPLVIVVFCLIALPWYVLCALRNPDFLNVFIWQHNFERYLTPVFEHRQPFWYYGPIFLLAIFPWLPFLAGVILDAVKGLKHESLYDSPGTFLTCWTMFPIVFFSLSQSKLPGYILPALPPFFILAGKWVSLNLAENKKAVLWTLALTGGLFVPIAIYVFAGSLRGIQNLQRPEYLLAGCVAGAFGLAVVILAFKKLPNAALVTLVLLSTSIVVIANRFVLPRLDPRISARSIAQKLQPQDPGGKNIAVYGLSRNWQFGMNYYFGRELPEWEPGSGEPDWILSGKPTGLPATNTDYKIEVSVSGPENRNPIALFRRQ